MALSAADSGSDAGSMDAGARLGREESRKRCGESSRQLASRSPWLCDFALYPVSFFSLGLFDHFALPEQDPNSRVGHFLCYANGRAYCDRLERLI